MKRKNVIEAALLTTVIGLLGSSAFAQDYNQSGVPSMGQEDQGKTETRREKRKEKRKARREAMKEKLGGKKHKSGKGEGQEAACGKGSCGADAEGAKKAKEAHDNAQSGDQ